jgi:D-3-phosphoglycerate dehydrogenase
MMKVLIPDKIEQKVIEVLEDAGFDVDFKPGITVEDAIKIVGDVDAMIVRSGIKVNQAMLDAAPKLKLVVRAGVGYDNIDTQYAARLGVAVENTPFGNTNAAAEHTLALLFLLAKKILQGQAELKGGTWNRKLEGTELKGKTLGVLGLGNVGKKVAKVALALEMHVIGYDPYLDEKAIKEIGATKATLAEILKSADYITFHLPLNAETKNMISTAQFALMKDGVKILNVARGGVIDELALEEAIKAGKVAGAALDVYEQEPPTCRSLIETASVICTPHQGASTKEAQINVGLDAANQVIAALKERKIISCVNGVSALKS